MSSSSSFPKLCDSKRIRKVHVYRPKLSAGTARRRIRLYHVIFLVFYIYQVGWLVSTIGEPYRKFLEKADREEFEVMEGAAKMKAQLEHTYGDLDDPLRRTRKLGWFDWVGMDVEELAAEKKRDKEKTVLDALPKRMRVPSRYAPAFLPSLLLGIMVVLHVLIQLLQHWLVGFQVWMNYREVNADQADLQRWLEQEEERFDATAAANAMSDAAVAAALAEAIRLGHDDPLLARFAIPEQRLPSYLPTHARVIPAKGRQILVPLTYYPTLGMTLEYHRRRYVYQPDVNMWSKIRCRTDFGLKVLERWQGMQSLQHLVCGQIQYGSNLFSVKQPTFKELYQKQLLSPFTVFQLFCVILWLLDNYWQYSIFTLVMILAFEATVVFARLKSLQALRGMGNKSRSVLVHRQGHWMMIDSTELLPGDIMSLTRIRPHYVKAAAAAAAASSTAIADKKEDGEAKKKDDDSTKKKAFEPMKVEDEGGEVVPADLLLLRGSTVVNEASLTGESIPQMKEGLSELEEGECLNMKDKHKMNVVYAGTKMLQCKGSYTSSSSGSDGGIITGTCVGNAAPPKLFHQIPDPPDGGCVCFVLRTGFSSAQGKLVRMIEGSQEKVKGHERDTGFLLLLLFFFALASSSYVLYHGLRNDNRSQYELLLHCILIITSVIPPDLPMQTALAVNNSLMTLMKLQVFCTEPNRVPIAGKLDACLFDKTGTLTTDELVAVGLCDPVKLKTPKGMEDEDDHFLTPMTKVNNEAALVLAGCHSLIVVDDETIGDPLENAALSAMRWKLSPTSGHAVPAVATEKRPEGKVIKLHSGESISDVEVIIRHHFSSKLQRMSCVARSFSRFYAVAKGSSEAIGSLLAVKPEGYDDKAKFLSKQGYRVIALAYKNLTSTEETDRAKESRTNCEEGLVFAGFIAFTCRVRKDTASVLKRLKEGGMSIAMVTGDALLTAVHVAKEVSIFEPLHAATEEVEGEEIVDETNEELRALLDEKRARAGMKRIVDNKKQKQYRPILLLEQTEGGVLKWCSYEDGHEVANYVSTDVPILANSNDLATTGKSLAAALECDPGTKKILGYIKVFARMTPDAKETVIECLHSVGSLCLMCGDGANDVGALKQADVGVALLSGFGDVNVDKGEDASKKEKKDNTFTAIMSQQHLNEIRALPVMLIKMKLRQMGVDPSKYPELIEKEDLVKLYQIKSREIAIREHDKKNLEVKAKQTYAERQAEYKAAMAEKQKKMNERIDELTAQGETWAQFKVMREFWASEMAEGNKRKMEMAKFSGVEGSAAAIVAQLEDMDKGALPMVKLGDASIAAPFTSKMPSIRSCVDIVRQGRCTLVSSIQMYQILALQCLISSYSLSALYLEGVKYGDTQMTAIGMLGSISFMSISRSKPLDRLSRVRPLTSTFHPALFLSLLGQFAVHLTTMMWAVHSAKQRLPPDHQAELDGEFKPGILNTVVFLVSNVQHVTVFVVNLQGRPFMTGLTENRPLLWSLIITFILTFMFASETMPGLNKYFQLVPFPEPSYRDFILRILMLDVGLTLFWDRLMKFIFCPQILMASLEGTKFRDIFGLVRTVTVIYFIMTWMLQDESKWEQLMKLEGRLDELGENGTNATNITDAVESLTETIGDCVGAACQALLANDTITDAIKQEF